MPFISFEAIQQTQQGQHKKQQFARLIQTTFASTVPFNPKTKSNNRTRSSATCRCASTWTILHRRHHRFDFRGDRGGQKSHYRKENTQHQPKIGIHCRSPPPPPNLPSSSSSRSDPRLTTARRARSAFFFLFMLWPTPHHGSARQICFLLPFHGLIHASPRLGAPYLPSMASLSSSFSRSDPSFSLTLSLLSLSRYLSLSLYWFCFGSIIWGFVSFEPGFWQNQLVINDRHLCLI